MFGYPQKDRDRSLRTTAQSFDQITFPEQAAPFSKRPNGNPETFWAGMHLTLDCVLLTHLSTFFTSFLFILFFHIKMSEKMATFLHFYSIPKL